ncbi:hypothetical protein ACFQT0_31120 [Hymenobacter humi]|uniref:LysR substrate-binding domain-containing protein n=1 Tax=Hymenobacter humi TaxID=1411620 RepID=A0ABW2UEA1_9BACT
MRTTRFGAAGRKSGCCCCCPPRGGWPCWPTSLGHVLAGRTQGLGFRWLAVGPFRWTRERGRGRLTWRPDQPAAGGLAVCVPRPMPAACGGASWPLPPAAPGQRGVRRRGLGRVRPAAPAAGAGRVLGGALAVSGLMSGALALVALVPRPAASDGARLLALWRGGPAAQRAVALLAAELASLAGARPRERARPRLEADAAPG